MSLSPLVYLHVELFSNVEKIGKREMTDQTTDAQADLGRKMA